MEELGLFFAEYSRNFAGGEFHVERAMGAAFQRVVDRRWEHRFDGLTDRQRTLMHFQELNAAADANSRRLVLFGGDLDSFAPGAGASGPLLAVEGAWEVWAHGDWSGMVVFTGEPREETDHNGYRTRIQVGGTQNLWTSDVLGLLKAAGMPRGAPIILGSCEVGSRLDSAAQWLADQAYPSVVYAAKGYFY